MQEAYWPRLETGANLCAFPALILDRQGSEAMQQSTGESTELCDLQRLSFDHEVAALLPALRRFAKQYCKQDIDVDDLVQETVLKAFRFHAKFRPGTRLKSWLFTIMRNHFLTAYHVQVREPVIAHEGLIDTLTTRPNQEWVLHMRDVERAIGRLPVGQRAALMQISDGISYDKAAENLGCEVGTIKSRVSRARHSLMGEMGEIFTASDA